MKPSVGRIVHYTNLGDRDGKYPPEIQAALITKVIGPCEPDTDHPGVEGHYRVSLHVFYESGGFDMMDVKYTSAPAGSEDARGHWTWQRY